MDRLGYKPLTMIMNHASNPNTMVSNQLLWDIQLVLAKSMVNDGLTELHPRGTRNMPPRLPHPPPIRVASGVMKRRANNLHLAENHPRTQFSFPETEAELRFADAQ